MHRGEFTHTWIKPSKKLVVVGSSAVDITAQVIKTAAFNTHSTVPGSVRMTLGGVARNVAEAAHRRLSASMLPLTGSAVLVSAVGDDSFGRLLTEESKQIGMRTDGLLPVANGRTAVCNMMLDSNGGLAGGIADMDIVESLDAESVSYRTDCALRYTHRSSHSGRKCNE